MSDLTIICVAYKRYENIRVLVHCLFAQTTQNFKLIVLHDGYDKRMDDILGEYKKTYPNFDYHFSETRYNDYGHSLRDYGLTLVDSKYVLITNDDNYYCSKFLELMFDAAESQSADIVMCNMIHSHMNPGGRLQMPYKHFETGAVRGSIDIGCFIARSDLAKRVGFRDKTHDGDATYFEDLMNVAPGLKIAKVDNVLFVHN